MYSKTPPSMMNKSHKEESSTERLGKSECQMYSKTPPSMMNKRPNEESSTERLRKSKFGNVKVENNAFIEEQAFRFRILLPNGMTLELKMREIRSEVPIEEFIAVVKTEYYTLLKQKSSSEPKRRINWMYSDLHLTDALSNNIRTEVKLCDFMSNKWHFLRLHDGSAEPDTYEDMWDLTPDTDLLKELPDEYTFETALADLIDNSLQAVWSNRIGERRLISVELHKNKILIFDSGPGMDGANEKIVKWGKMGASLHRSSRERAIGGKPPYLMPRFGMFGYGGPVATMYLGRRALVSSKIKTCNKVFTLHMEREALISSSRSEEDRWKTKGGMRDPFEAEKKNSPHGSFTKVEILEPKTSYLDIKQLQCKLKDIYFPYIQCDEMSGKTSTPIEFQVNGINLTEIEGGEVAVTNLHSCNGPEFVLLLHFSFSEDTSSVHSQRKKAFLEANARLRCVYFPVIEGEESILKIINKLEADGFEMSESYEGFSRVSVRRLGRLLPDARWAWLPFMEPKQKKGEKAQSLKRCCYRVKCFIETDSGFNPTPSKTDLAHHHPYTTALKNFGNRTPVNEKEVQIEIYRDEKKLNLSQLEKQYHDWIFEMHDQYDDEIDKGQDQPTIVVSSSKIKKLGISSDVLRVHKEIKRKGKCWKSGQKIKVLKGACAGCHKSNVFATLEYIILEGLPGEACGEARLICRPLGLPEEKGCRLSVENGNKTLDIHDSLSLPISVIDSEQCITIDDVVWKNLLEKNNKKLPSTINLLSHEDCQELEIEGGLLPDAIEAGDAFPENIVAVIRPKAFESSSSQNTLDQKFIIKENFEMILEVSSFRDDSGNARKSHIYSVRITPSSHKGLHGLYIFQLRSKIRELGRAGFYAFLFSLTGLKDVQVERVMQVKASTEVDSWKLLSHNPDSRCRIRVGSRFPSFSVACYDRYNNRVPLTSIPKPTIKLVSDGCVLAQVRNMRTTTDVSTMTIKDIIVESSDLDVIRPNYEATLNISSLDEGLSVDCPCQVIPGPPQNITVYKSKLKRLLLPGQIVEELVLEVFDAYGNHVKEDEIILLHVDGFLFQDESSFVHSMRTDCTKKVDAKGFVDLSNILKVSKGYDKDVSLSVISKEKIIFKVEFQTEIRELQTVSKVFKHCKPGSRLENIEFEIVNSEGIVDESINDDDTCGELHTLTLKSDSLDMDNLVRYGFCHGRCTIRAIPLPQREGIFSFTAVHSRYPELNLDIEVHVEKVWRENLVGNHEGLGNCEISPQVSCRNLPIPLQFPAFNIPEVENIKFSPKSLKRNALPLDYSPYSKMPKPQRHIAQNENSDRRILPIHVSVSQDRENLADYSMVCPKELEDDLANCGLTIGEHENELKILNLQRAKIQQHISDFQASLHRDFCNVSSAFGKELIIKQIESRDQYAASFVCKLLKDSPFEERPGDLLGVVALLGSVQSIELSRMLARYLGEDQMLAIVCKNYAAAYSFETDNCHEFGTKFGQSSGSCLAFCLEDIRPIIRESGSDPQNRIFLQRPTLPNGNVPQGFLGFAVNMISIEASHLHWRTKNGHGLRETLFYRLFGELQVYKDMKCMKMADSCITDGAISLDGHIIRGNGLVCLGNWEPDIFFPVENEMPISATNLQALRWLEEKNLELTEIDRQIEEKNTSYLRDMKSFQRSRNRYNDYLSWKESQFDGTSHIR